MRPLLALSLLAAPAAAPAQNPPASADVVVTGTRDPQAEVKQFVEALTAVEGGPRAQIARFERREVCPAGLGIGDAQKATLVARMRRVAASAGVPVARARCAPNVLVVVTRDKHAFVAALAKSDGTYFGYRSKREVQELVDAPGPVTAWQVTGPQLNADGVEIPDPRTGEVAVNNTVAPGSRITSASRPQVAGAIVVIDAAALQGLTVTQVADYAAMRAFTTADPAKLANTRLPTILKVLDAPMGEEVPVTLTSWDMNLLTALYRAPNNLPAAQQRSAIGRRLDRTVGGAGAPAPTASPTP